MAVKATAHLKWAPNPGPQTEAYFSEADELFYGGAAGGGKTDLIIGLALDAHEKTTIFRREGTDLESIISRAAAIVGNRDGLGGKPAIWKLGGDKRIKFASCPHENDKEKYQGQPDDLKAFDEITQFTRSQYEYIIGWNRSTKKGQRCRVVCAGNPPTTPEGQWVKECWAPWLDPTFENPAGAGELRWFTTIKGKTVWVDKDWRGTDEDGNEIRPKSRTFIPARLSDNPELGDDYRVRIQAMPEPIRSKLLYGDFNVAEQDQENQVIPTAWVRAAMARWTPEKPGRMQAVGADIAQGGEDETALAPLYEDWYFDELVVKPGRETPGGPAASSLIIATLRDGAQVNVDMGGGFGQSTYDHLTSNNIRCAKMVPTGESTETTKGESRLEFVNKRAEWWWKFREALDPANNSKVALPRDERMLADLCAPTWKLMPRGIQIEAKDMIKKRIGRSPDRGDAVVLANGERRRNFGGELDAFEPMAVA